MTEEERLSLEKEINAAWLAWLEVVQAERKAWRAVEAAEAKRKNTKGK